MQENKLYEIMSSKSTYELVDILTHRKDHYRSEAILVIVQVLKERNVSEEEMSNLAERSEAEHVEKQNARAKNRSLLQGPGIIVTVLILLAFFLLVPERDWIQSAVFAVIGFGGGHAVNYFYFRSKSSNEDEKSEL